MIRVWSNHYTLWIPINTIAYLFKYFWDTLNCRPAKSNNLNKSSQWCHSCHFSYTFVAALSQYLSPHGDPFKATLLPLVLKSSTRMISLRRCGGDLLSTLCTERRSVDHTSSTKQKITLVEGKSSWTRFCAQLENKHNSAWEITAVWGEGKCRGRLTSRAWCPGWLGPLGSDRSGRH